jgi:hypothetical protein
LNRSRGTENIDVSYITNIQLAGFGLVQLKWADTHFWFRKIKAKIDLIKRKEMLVGIGGYR